MTDDFDGRLSISLRAETNLMAIETAEWQRLEAAIIKSISNEAKALDSEERIFLRFNETQRLQRWDGRDWDSEDDMLKMVKDKPMAEILRWYRNDFIYPSVMLLDDQHVRLDDADRRGASTRDAMMWHLRNFVRLKVDDCPSASRKTIIISGSWISAIKEVKHEIIRMEMPLPDDTVIKTVLNQVASSRNLSSSQISNSSELVNAALGLTVMEAESAFNHAIAETGSLLDDSIKLIMRHKKEIIHNSGALEYIEPEEGLDDVGGLDRLKDWLSTRRRAYSPEAIARNLPQPKGVLLVGVPGCGKSLTAKAVASAWNYPLIRFDLGAVFQGVVGSSEHNIRNALKVAEAAAPCILWIDEIEKGLAGSGGSGNLDSGVTLRVFGTVLTWLNEVKKPVFVVATANNIKNLPTELKRKGRFDEIFFIDLPDQPTRADIFEIHIKRFEEPSLSNIDLNKLADRTGQWTGAEIGQVVKDARFRSFDDGNRPLKEMDILESIKRCTPMAEGMKEEIEYMRAEADIIGQRASSKSKPRAKTGGGNVYAKDGGV